MVGAPAPVSKGVYAVKIECPANIDVFLKSKAKPVIVKGTAKTYWCHLEEADDETCEYSEGEYYYSEDEDEEPETGENTDYEEQSMVEDTKNASQEGSCLPDHLQLLPLENSAPISRFAAADAASAPVSAHVKRHVPPAKPQPPASKEQPAARHQHSLLVKAALVILAASAIIYVVKR